jgi:hypothetical protein
MSERFRSILNSVSPPGIALFFAVIFAAALILTTLFRSGFLLKYRGLTVGVPFFTLPHSFIIGGRFDTVVPSYVVVPLFI